VSTQCTACHAAEAAASQAAATEWNSAWSGLHARTGSVSGENHTASDSSAGDRTDSSQCTQCHGLPNQHFAGLDNTALDALTEADFVATYDGVDGNISSSGCAVTCHSDSDGSTSRWVRKWSSTIVNTDGTECNNCHGVWNAWVSGVVHRGLDNVADSGPQNMHGTNSGSPNFGCNECHGWNSAQYDFNPKWDNTVGGAGDHGNERITMNDNGSNVARNGTGLTGCSGCHNGATTRSTGLRRASTASRR
jgi:hypothetical protein